MIIVKNKTLLLLKTEESSDGAYIYFDIEFGNGEAIFILSIVMIQELTGAGPDNIWADENYVDEKEDLASKILNKVP